MCKSNTQPKQNKTTINNVRPFPVLLVLIYQPCASFIFAGFIVLNSSVTRRGSRMKLMVAGSVYSDRMRWPWFESLLWRQINHPSYGREIWNYSSKEHLWLEPIYRFHKYIYIYIYQVFRAFEAFDRVPVFCHHLIIRKPTGWQYIATAL